MPEEINVQSTEPSVEKTYTAEEMQAELNRVGAKEARKATAAILKKLGVQSEDELSGLLEKLAPKPEPPAKTPEKPDDITHDKLKELLGPLVDRLGAIETVNKQALAERVEKQQLEYLAGQNVPKEQLRYYRFEIGQLVNAETTFEEAAAQFIKANPPHVRPPEFHVGGGRAPISAMNVDEYKKLGYAERLELKEKNPNLFEKLQNALKGK